MVVEVTTDSVNIIEMSPIHEGDFSVNECTFILPECFEGLSVTASFNGLPVLISKNNTCIIPSLKSGNVKLSVYAYSNVDGALEMVYSPKPTQFFVFDGSFAPTETNNIPELSQCEAVLNSYKGYILQEANEDAAVKKMEFKDCSVMDIPTGAYWLLPGTKIYSKDDILYEGFLIISQLKRGSRWFFFGLMNDSLGGWEGNTFLSNDDMVISITNKFGNPL